jgi:hypothetical protein
MLIRELIAGTLFFAMVTVEQIYAQTVASDKSATVLFFPDFYRYETKKDGDTTYSYECYNRNEHKIFTYELMDVDDIDNIKCYRSFYTKPRMPNSPVSPPVNVKIQFQYVHPGHDQWLRYDPTTGEIAHYKIFKNKIVRTDSIMITDPATNNKRSFVYEYFKTQLMRPVTGEDRKH